MSETLSHIGTKWTFPTKVVDFRFDTI